MASMHHRDRTNLPILCKLCMGDNPMITSYYNKECKVCSQPFSGIVWWSGRDSLYKKTWICRSCCDVCQGCGDIWYKKPAPVPSLEISTPHGRTGALVCRSFVRGQCERGLGCPFRHVMPGEQDIDHGYFTRNLESVGEMQDDESFRNPPLCVGGTPYDESIRSLYVGGVEAWVSKQDLKDIFHDLVNGEIESLDMLPQQGCALVTYTTRDGAEKAAKKLHNKLVAGIRLSLMWATPEDEAAVTSPWIRQPLHCTKPQTSLAKNDLAAAKLEDILFTIYHI